MMPFALWQLCRMPFRLIGAAQTFQRLMDNVLRELPLVIRLLGRYTHLHNHVLIIRLEKCSFGCSTLDFLGHRISATSCTPLPSKVKPIPEFPCPTYVADLQGFLGMLNFYHHFIPHAADLLHLLQDSLRKKKPCDSLLWTTSHEQSIRESTNGAL
jgi:hypothetical protein